MADSPWRRVCVIGCCAAGKSTIAARLGRALDLPVVHLDVYHWKPGWVREEPRRWRAVVEDLVAADAWVQDGNYAGTLDVRLPRADLVVFVDYPRRVCLFRAYRRLLRSRGRPWNVPGCPERVDAEMRRYLWRWPTEGRPRTLGLVREYASPGTVVTLSSPRAAERWLRSVES